MLQVQAAQQLAQGKLFRGVRRRRAGVGIGKRAERLVHDDAPVAGQDQLVQLALPSYGRIVMNEAFRAFPDADADAHAVLPAQDTPEQMAMRKLLSGLHL